MGFLRGFVPLLLLTVSLSLPSELKFCIQAAAERSFERIKNYYEKVRDLPEARVEKRGQVFLLRIGVSESRSELQTLLKRVRKNFRDAYIKKCEIDPGYVVLPVQKKEEEKAEESPEEEKLKIDEAILHLEEIRKRLEEVAEKVEDLSSLNKNLEGLDVFFRIANPQTLEKFLISIGILIGGLFLFTWILILWVYRKVSHSSKAIDLLSRGYEVKRKGEKILYRKEEDQEWKEA